MSVELKRIGWENGTLVSKAKANIDGTIYEVEPAQYSGKTPMSAENFKKMEDNAENAINEATKKNIITGEEFETNEFIDGKKIYRKRINCGQLPNPGQSSTTSTELTGVTYIGLEGGFNPDDSQFVPCNIYFNSNLSIGAFIQDNKIRINNNESGSRTGIVYVTVYYTKN